MVGWPEVGKVDGADERIIVGLEECTAEGIVEGTVDSIKEGLDESDSKDSSNGTDVSFPNKVSSDIFGGIADGEIVVDSFPVWFFSFISIRVSFPSLYISWFAVLLLFNFLSRFSALSWLTYLTNRSFFLGFLLPESTEYWPSIWSSDVYSAIDE